MDMRPDGWHERQMTYSDLPENRLMACDTPAPNPLLEDWCGPYGLLPKPRLRSGVGQRGAL